MFGFWILDYFKIVNNKCMEEMELSETWLTAKFELSIYASSLAKTVGNHFKNL